MKLQNLEFLKLMPKFMQTDECIKSLCKSVDEIFKPTAEDLKKLSDWDRIDSMSESELDYLAWECNITWYDKSAPIATKRSLVKNSDKIFMTRATVAAVEEVVATYFNDATLLEFWEAGCEPHHFKIECSDPSTYADNLQLFLSTLEKVKRKSQWLESIVLLLMGEGNMYVGAGTSEILNSSFDCTNEF
ncbi:MAG: phage tail protein I [Bacteroidales bacterium]|nr:phage tail protein I [Bacteroidales bacterium]MBR1625604.1 phage tail protein I [Bacteroidales bacterium]